MSRPDHRRHRRGRNDAAPPPSDQGEAVTPQPVALESKETEGFLLHRLNTASNDGRTAQQQATAAATEAHRQDQLATQYEASETELFAQLQQVQLDKETAARRAEEARAASATFTAQQMEFKKQEADALRLCIAAGINVEPLPLRAPSGIDPAGPTRVDLSDDPRMNGPMDRFNDAHNEEDQQDPQAGAA